MTEKSAEFRDIPQGRRVRGDKLDYLATTCFTHGAMEQHDRLRADQARGIDQEIMFRGHLLVLVGWRNHLYIPIEWLLIPPARSRP